MIKRGEKNGTKIKNEMRKMICQRKGVAVDYISVVDTENLKDVGRVKKGTLIAVAARLGKTRLIDNIIV